MKTYFQDGCSGWMGIGRAGRMVAVLLGLLPVVAQAQYTYAIRSGTVAITRYNGSGGAVTTPGTIEGLPVTSIEELAFSASSGLTAVTISPGVTNIGNYAFSSCRSLTNVVLPASVDGIGTRVFVWCDSLAAIRVDADNPTYGSEDGVLFDKRTATLLHCPARKAGTYTIPPGTARIGNMAFGWCTNLTGVAIPDSTTVIAEEAFVGCQSLTAIAISAGVASIGTGAFSGCESLAAIHVAAGNATYSSLDGVLFDHGRTLLIQYPEGKAGSYAIPNGVARVGIGGFTGCRKLTSVAIPVSFTNIPRAMFYDCTGLSGVLIPASVVRIESEAFFRCASLASIAIPDSVIGIGSNAFAYCSGLAEVMIGNGLADLAEGAFASCPKLVEFTVSEGNSAYSSVDGVLFNKSRTTLVRHPEGKAGSYAIPAGVTHIGNRAFSGCGRLTGVAIPASVSVIGNSAFAGCTGLVGMRFPGVVDSIGSGAFDGGTGLTRVYFQCNAPGIGGLLFNGANQATVYYLPWTTGWGATFGGRPTATYFPPPQSLSPADGQVIKIRRPPFSWTTTAVGATWHYIWINRDGQTYLKQWVEGTNTWTPSGDLPGGNYRWWVQLWGPQIGYSEWSAAAEFSLAVQIPGPLVPIAPQGEQNVLTLDYRWQKDVKATWYNLWVGRDGGTRLWTNRWVQMSGTGQASVTFSNHPQSTFQWWIRGWSVDGYGPWSGPMSFSTPNPAPAKPVLVSPLGASGPSVVFQWNPAARAQWYRLYVQRGTVKTIDQWTQATNWNAGAQSAGSYSWWVGAWNDTTRTTVWSDRGDFTVP